MPRLEPPHAPRGAAVHSLHRIVYTVPDLDEAERFYRCFGLDVTRDAGGLSLRTTGRSHVWARLRQAAGPKRLRYLSFGIFAEALPAFRERVAAAGLGCEPPPDADPADDAGSLWLRTPDGTPVQLVVAAKVSPAGKGPAPAAVAVAPGQGAAPARSQVEPVRPRGLSHALFFTPDVGRMVAFCTAVLGLRLSDRSGEVIAFLHGVHGSDHHLVAFAKSHAPGLHHTSWDVASVEEVGRGAEQMRQAGHGLGWGLGRHVLGSNYFHYVRDPWGSFAEYSFDIDYIPAGLDWPAADHPPEDSLYVWGPPLPEDFITNHEQPAG